MNPPSLDPTLADPTLVARSTLPTRFGTFEFLVFRSSVEPSYGLSREHIVLLMGELGGQSDVLLRVQSECITGEVFGSLRCDCRQQLETAQEQIAKCGCGVIVYLRQEGRSVGLSNKIRAYALQDQGADTIDANLQLELPADARDYRDAASILRQLDVRSVRLLTNSPEKHEALAKLGVQIAARVPVRVQATPHSEHYLRTKKERLLHEIPEEALRVLASQK